MIPLQRLVVVAPGRPGPALELPGSRFSPDRPFISGGERSLYELAVAGAVLGLEVELRGDINRIIFETVTSAAGAGPRVGLEPRRPDGADLIVIPETAEKNLLATLALSSARRVMLLLAPPGLCGWSFEPGWTVPDSMTVPLDAIGTPWSYRQLEGSGLTLWTNAHGIAEAGCRSGVEVEWIGTGTPVPFPDEIAKQFDVAVVVANRWAGWAREVADRLDVAIGPQRAGHTLGLLPQSLAGCRQDPAVAESGRRHITHRPRGPCRRHRADHPGHQSVRHCR